MKNRIITASVCLLLAVSVICSGCGKPAGTAWGSEYSGEDLYDWCLDENQLNISCSGELYSALENGGGKEYAIRIICREGLSDELQIENRSAGEIKKELEEKRESYGSKPDAALFGEIRALDTKLYNAEKELKTECLKRNHEAVAAAGFRSEFVSDNLYVFLTYAQLKELLAQKALTGELYLTFAREGIYEKMKEARSAEAKAAVTAEELSDIDCSKFSILCGSMEDSFFGEWDGNDPARMSAALEKLMKQSEREEKYLNYEMNLHEARSAGGMNEIYNRYFTLNLMAFYFESFEVKGSADNLKTDMLRLFSEDGGMKNVTISLSDRLLPVQ